MKIREFPCFPLLNLLLRIPYTHRIDRGNNQFQIMQKIFTGLENAFVGTGWSWKPHKSKEHIFLHRNYTQKISQLRKKNENFSIEKNFRNFFDEKKSRKIRPKIESSTLKKKNFSGRKIWNFRFLVGFSGENFSSKTFSIFFRSWENLWSIVSM